jgi:hypothetical protein
MRSATAGILVVLILALSACSSTATKAFTVDVSPYSIEQTPGQIHNYLRARGFQRVKFQDYRSGLIVYEKRNSEKRRRTFEKSGPRVIVWFGEDGRRDFSEFALEEYNRLLDEVSQTVGADRVKVWPNQPPGSGQW